MVTQFKLAYLIIAHKNPQQIARLITTLNNENSYFFIHFGKDAGDEQFNELRDLTQNFRNLQLVNIYACSWGSFNLVKAELEGISAFISQNIDFDYMILLSGQDYPIKPKKTIDKLLENNKGGSFLSYRPFPDPGIPEGGVDRYEYMHIHLPFRRASLYNRIPVPLKTIFYFIRKNLIPKRKFPRGFVPYVGSQYWCLSRDCVRYIYDFMLKEKEFMRFFRHVDIADELFFQTVLINSPLRDSLINDNLTFMIWDKGKTSPNILRKQDFDKIVVSEKMFARKFDSDLDSEILDLIDQQLQKVLS